MNEIELNVVGMACTGCENRIKNAIKLIENIVDVEASYKTGKVKVIYNNEKEIDIEFIKRKIEDLGFEMN